MLQYLYEYIHDLHHTLCTLCIVYVLFLIYLFLCIFLDIHVCTVHVCIKIYCTMLIYTVKYNACSPALRVYDMMYYTQYIELLYTRSYNCYSILNIHILFAMTRSYLIYKSKLFYIFFRFFIPPTYTISIKTTPPYRYFH